MNDGGRWKKAEGNYGSGFMVNGSGQLMVNG